MAVTGFAAVREEVRRRIASRIWAPGTLIPNEEDLAYEFDCSRATVNRALRELAEAGLLDRRRKAGTRVVVNPVRKAMASIPIIRDDIANRGMTYSHMLLSRSHGAPPLLLHKAWGLAPRDRALHLTAVHLGDGQPVIYEDRWINTSVVPEALAADLELATANEWLIQNAPFSHGDIAFCAENAGQVAEFLRIDPAAAIFVEDRTTWDGARPITAVRLFHRPGFQMRMTI